MRVTAVMLALYIATALATPHARAAGRIETIQARGSLICGIVARVRGFTDIHPDGHISGFEPDLCRAVAAAVLGPDASVNYVTSEHVENFILTGSPDVVARRLTVTLRREMEPGLAFSRVMFFDGTALLIRSDGKTSKPSDLAGGIICVCGGSEAEGGLTAYFTTRHLSLQVRPESDLTAAADVFRRGDCNALAADLSELAPIRATEPDQFAILPDMLSKEPLALLTHADDAQFTALVNWTLHALLAAEELGVTQAMARSPGEVVDPDIRRLLGLDPGNGAALGVREAWASDAIATVGNYGEIYARNLGEGSALKLPRGYNALWRDGGLFYALPLR